MLHRRSHRVTPFFRAHAVLFVVVLFVSVCVSSLHAQESTSFKLHFDKSAFSKPFSGDVFVAFSQEGEPRNSMHQWFGAPPLARFEVNEVAPGGYVTLNLEDAAARSPLDWSEVIGKEWKMQAVARVNPLTRTAGNGEGDVYGDVISVQFDGKQSIALELNQVVKPENFEETERIKLFEIESPSLSKFHGFSYPIRAGIMLPKKYDPNKKYPLIYHQRSTLIPTVFFQFQVVANSFCWIRKEDIKTSITTYAI